MNFSFDLDDISMDDITTFVMILVIAAVVVSTIAVIVFKASKSKDLSMPLITKQAKILEKTISQGSVEWYNVELEDGERLKLRNLKAKTMIITAGDTGMLSYRGKTIVEFNRG